MKYIIKSLLIVSILFLIMGCETSSENIPTQFENVKSFLEEGWDYYVKADYDSALMAFNRAIERQSGNLEAHNGAAWCLYHQNELDKAAAKFQFVVSLAEINNVTEMLASGYAGLTLTGIKQMINAVENGKPAGEVDEIKLNKIIQNGNKLYEIDPNYQHPYEPDVINVENILIAVAESYYNIQYFYEAAKKIDAISSEFLQNLLQTVPHNDVVDTFMTAPINDDGEVFIDWSEDGVITIDNVKAVDGGNNPAFVALISGSQVKFNDDVDLYEETLQAVDTVVNGDTVFVVKPSQQTIYKVNKALDENLFSRKTEIIKIDGNFFVVIKELENSQSVTLEYRYKRKFEIQFKKTSDFYLYLDKIAAKLFDLKSS